MALAAVIAAAMCLLSFLFPPDRPFPGQPGICLPPPSAWDLSPLVSWILNIALLGTITVGIWLLNQKYNLIRTTEPVEQVIFLIFVASNPWITAHLSSSLILCGAIIISLWILFGCYDSPNATHQMFAVATFVSVGSMFQYGFLPFIAFFIITAGIMKIFRLKEMIAFFLGLVSPYWVGVGLGWIPLSYFRLPSLSPLLENTSMMLEIFFLMASVATAIFIGLICGVIDSVKIYAGNSQVSAMNNVVYWLGFICVACVLVDFNNMFTYIPTLYFTVAVQLANLCALRKFKHEWLVTFLPSLVFIGFFIVFMLSSF